MSPCTYTARWIFPVATGPLEHGTITIDADKIVSVEPHGTRTPDVDLGKVAILPGFVNAHTHLDLTGARGLAPVAHAPGSPDFTQWLRSVVAFRRSRSPDQVQADISVGIAECLRHGTTSIGDIASGGASWGLLGRAACRARMFYELIGLSDERAKMCWQTVQEWWKDHPTMQTCFTGLSPHAPYSVRSSLYSILSSRTTLPIAMHLAETQAELDLLHSHAGPLVDFLKELGVWDPSGLAADPLDVVRLLPRGIFVHGNYLDPATPFLPAQSLVVCPRTHAAFGHPRHPFPEFLKRGVRVALGTDSLASNPDLDILAEARFLRRHYPEVDPALLLRMLTLSGAEALGFDGVTGSLTPGKSADLVVLQLPNEEGSNAHDLVFESAIPVQRVMFRGEWNIPR